MPPVISIVGDFPPATEADWRTLATRSQAEAMEALRSASLDGLSIGPIYPPGHGPVLHARREGSRWTVLQRIDHGDASRIRAAVETAIRGGAGGIDLVCSTSPAAHGRGVDPGVVVPGVVSDTGAAVLRIDAGEETSRLSSALIEAGVQLVAAYDPVSTLAAQGGLDRPLAAHAAGIAALIAALEAAGQTGVAFIADGRVWHDGGASEVQELAAVLASAVECLRRIEAQGLEPARAARRLGVALSADADQFLIIAKFRAVRLLFARLFEVSGIAQPQLPVHAETAWRMQSLREPTMNMVRATTATFAAAIGGADSITVLPSPFESGEFADRMARNTQTILDEESSLGRVGDPGAGAGAIETLTGQLAEAAWDCFTRIEIEGGLPAALKSGSIQQAVAVMRDRRLAGVARRAIPLVGVNVHVDRTAPLSLPAPPRQAGPRKIDVEPLHPIRLAEPFEALWARAAAGGKPPVRAMLVPLGRIGGDDISAAADAFAAGGFDVIVHDGRGDATLPEGFIRSAAQVACLLGDAEASGRGLRVAAMLREAGASVVVAAGPLASVASPGDFDAMLLPDTDIVGLIGDVLDRIAAVDQNGQS